MRMPRVSQDRSAGDKKKKRKGVAGCVLIVASMIHLRELQVLHCVLLFERDREVVGKLACY